MKEQILTHKSSGNSNHFELVAPQDVRTGTDINRVSSLFQGSKTETNFDAYHEFHYTESKNYKNIEKKEQLEL